MLQYASVRDAASVRVAGGEIGDRLEFLDASSLSFDEGVSHGTISLRSPDVNSVFRGGELGRVLIRGGRAVVDGGTFGETEVEGFSFGGGSFRWTVATIHDGAFDLLRVGILPTIVEIYGGEFGSLDTHGNDRSAFHFFGGTVLGDFLFDGRESFDPASASTIHGGLIQGKLIASKQRETTIPDEITIAGGELLGGIDLLEGARAILLGGEVGSRVYLEREASLWVYGDDLEFAGARLQGALADGTPLDLPFEFGVIYDRGMEPRVYLNDVPIDYYQIPEPAGAALAILAASCGLMARRRRCHRRGPRK